MRDRVRCTRCGKVYDLGMVEVTARYADCSMWKCPGCGVTCDDRVWRGGVRGYVHIGDTETDIWGNPFDEVDR
jgi:hypothetical protein